ncbi:MAG: ATP-grasp domain-containing protein [Gemmataceae bacterium]|nr:ATP-grasp domain-containing protein [Gemmataceae bacterium]
MNDGKLIVVGASARAAAMSVRRAGLVPFAVDLFADRDLQAIADVNRLTEYPAGILYALASSPAGPWMYTGGVENFPDLIEECSRIRHCLGAEAGVVRRVRDPDWLAANLPMADLAVGKPTDRDHWLVKPRHGAGGSGILRWNGAELPTDHYLQREIVGKTMTGQYLGRHCLGVTEQLTGLDWLHATPFSYCGSIGPIEIPTDRREWWDRTGEELERAGLIGLYGVDVIDTGADYRIVEVNPRYTAAMEVIELACRRSSVAMLIGRESPAAWWRPVDGMAGKAVWFAGTEFEVRRELPFETDPWVVPAWADVPDVGTRFRPGEPVISIFCVGRGPDECRAVLNNRADWLERSELHW